MTKKAVNGAAANDIIEIAVDNPTSMEALPPMCPQLSATHLETVAVDNGWHVYIQKN
jgi:tRNA 2-thiouridine synthesizing protein A